MPDVRGQSGARPFQVMAKPIGPRCNLDCGYCYYLDKAAMYPAERRFRMTDAVLERFVAEYIAAQVAAGAPEVWFVWQGGEPTMLGLGYFERIVELQARFRTGGRPIRNALQTNGTLLTEAWARFLRRRDFLVGLSLDGPPALHDDHRRDPRGGATADRVLAALSLLRAHQVEFNVLTVVHRDNARRPLEIYRFLREQGVAFMQFIPAVERRAPGGGLAGPPTGPDLVPSVTPWSVRPDDYGAFLSAIFDEWVRRDVGRVFVQLFDVLLGLWVGGPAALCVFGETCGEALVLEHNGDLYACDHYVYPEHRLGNIMERSLAELAASACQRRFGEDKRRTLPDSCLGCRYRFACNGGCPKHRFLTDPAGGSRGLNYLCAANRRFLDHAAPLFDAMADLVRRGAPAAAIMPALARAEGRRAAGRNDACACGSGRKVKHCCGA